MNFNLKQPCNNCPFRKDKKSYLNKKRAKEIVQALTKENKTFKCHKTINYSNRDTINESHCAGSLIIMENNDIAYENNIIRIAERLRLYDKNILNLNSPVFDNFDDFINSQEV